MEEMGRSLRKRLELSEEMYRKFLALKNEITYKIRRITNPHVMRELKSVPKSHQFEKFEEIKVKYDFEPEYIWDYYLEDLVTAAYRSLETGEGIASTWPRERR